MKRAEEARRKDQGQDKFVLDFETEQAKKPKEVQGGRQGGEDGRGEGL